ncbi:uncharacterized protein V1516DRAFT_678395 [Lipomyces oligophaga]|uniref:uncharacterized protein n=1 Tax=Lipomyces oligophaga TaxID=45792 RepID=UPI0034CDD23D
MASEGPRPHSPSSSSSSLSSAARIPSLCHESSSLSSFSSMTLQQPAHLPHQLFPPQPAHQDSHSSSPTVQSSTSLTSVASTSSSSSVSPAPVIHRQTRAFSSTQQEASSSSSSLTAEQSPPEIASSLDSVREAVNLAQTQKNNFILNKTPSSLSLAASENTTKPMTAISSDDIPRDLTEYEYPSPKVYDLTLKLNSDPGLDNYWNNITEILESYFLAKRVSLTLPNDLTDIINTPWGLKGVWTSRSLPLILSRLQHHRDSRVAECVDRESDQAATDATDPLQPDLDDSSWEDAFEESEFEDRSIFESASTRISPLDSFSSDSTTIEINEPENEVVSPGNDETPLAEAKHRTSIDDYNLESFSDSISDDENLPFLSRKSKKVTRGTARVFSALRPLESDVDPLIDSVGVTRVLHRGKLVLLQREYRNLQLDHERIEAERKASQYSATSDATIVDKRSTRIASNNCKSRVRPRFRDPFEDSSRLLDMPYEDYEQALHSPWTNSPAPSPVIAKDSLESPFFKTEAKNFQVDEAFDTSHKEDMNGGTSTDYEDCATNEFQKPVRAIGLESSYSIIHIPLVHPSTLFSSRSGSGSRARNIVPIAIISILSDVIPYPPNLIKTLNSFSPHLATSFALAEAHSTLKHQVRHYESRDRYRPHIIHRISGSRTTREQLDRDSKAAPEHSRSYEDLLSRPGTPSDSRRHEGDRRLHSRPHLSRNNSNSHFYENRRNETFNYSTGSASFYDSAEYSTTTSPSGEVPSPGTQLPISKSEPERPSLSSPTSRLKLRHYRKKSLSIGAFNFQDSPPPLSPISSFSCLSPPVGGTGTTSSHNLPRNEDISYDSKMSMPSPRLLRTIIDSIPVHLHIADPKTGQITWVSARTLAYCGLSSSQYRRQPLSKRFFPEDQPIFESAWKNALKNGDPLNLQLRMRRFDGEYRYFVVRAVPLRDSKGAIVHWFGTNMDIHEQRLAELEAIKQSDILASQRRYRTLAESNPLIVFAATQNDGIVYANHQWETYSGQSYEDAKLLGFLEYIHPEDRDKCKLPTDPHASNFSCEVRLRNSAGEYKWHIVRCICSDDFSPKTRNPLIPTSAANEVTWFGTCTDINDHKVVEQKLQEAKESAQRTMELKARFLSNMSHEIRTPLIGISGMVNFLLDTSLTAEQLDYCHTIASSSEALLAVINDILDLSKAEAGKMRLNMQWFNLRWLIEDVNDLLSTLAISKNIELNYIVEQDVPAIVQGDRIRIRQVLLNIVGNAIKFTTKGEVFTQCSVEKRLADSIVLHFECHDTGAGFDKQEQEAMFKPFSQIDGVLTRKAGGSGLGLVISRQLIELHGGTISCKGEKGKGSTFYFTAEFGIPSEADAPVIAPLLRTTLSRESSISSNSSVAQEALGLRHSSISIPAQSPSLAFLASPINEYPLSPAVEGHYQLTPLSLGGGGGGSNSVAASAMAERMKMLRPRDPRTMRFKLPGQRSISESADYGSENSLSPSDSFPEPRRNKVHALIVCEFHYTTSAIIHHVRESLPADTLFEYRHTGDYEFVLNILEEAQQSRIADVFADAFTHVIINVNDCIDIMAIAVQIFKSKLVGERIKVVAIATPMQKSAILQCIRDKPSKPVNFTATGNSTDTGENIFSPVSDSSSGIFKDSPIDYNLLERELGLRFFFVSKPIKVSRLSAVFNPRSMSGSTSSVRSGGVIHASPVINENDDSAISGLGRRLSGSKAAVAQERSNIFRELQEFVAGQNFHVLLVEDNPVNQKVLMKFLLRGGLVVDTACDGEECTEKVFGSEPGFYNLIICDLHMPKKDGFQTCSEIRQWEQLNDFSRSPIIALSANVVSDVADQCALVGFTDYLTKPIDFTDFKNMIVRVLSTAGKYERK